MLCCQIALVWMFSKPLIISSRLRFYIRQLLKCGDSHMWLKHVDVVFICSPEPSQQRPNLICHCAHPVSWITDCSPVQPRWNSTRHNWIGFNYTFWRMENGSGSPFALEFLRLYTLSLIVCCSLWLIYHKTDASQSTRNLTLMYLTQSSSNK